MFLPCTSSIYCKDFNASSFAIDGDNRFHWRFSPRRLDVESWRDALLTVTGELDQQIGGPSIGDLFASRRRTFYARISRSGDKFQYDEFLRNFDFPTPRGSHAKRATSTVPQQFLFMLNSKFMVDRAKAFADRLDRESSSTGEQIERAYQLLFSRSPSEQELDLGRRFLQQNAPEDSREGENAPRLSNLQQYAQALLSSNEFMYIK